MNHLKLKASLLAGGLAWAVTAMATATLVQDVRVFDGERMHKKRSVLIDNGKIVDANFRGKAPAGVHIVDGTGRTLLPGLIDSHVHAYRYLDLPLLFGVTTQVDMFTQVPLMQDMTSKMKAGTNTHQADLFSAGTLVTAPGGHGSQYFPIPTLERAGDAAAFVAARVAEGSHFIKIVMESGVAGHAIKRLDDATVKAAIDATHRHGKLAVVHISTLDDARKALGMGADGLVHLFNGTSVSDGEIAELAKLAKQRNAFVVPTFSVLESIAGIRSEDLLADAALTDLLDREQAGTLKTSYSQVPQPQRMVAPTVLTGALHKAGVRVLAGTDAGNAGTQHGISLHHELGMLVKSGLTPVQALAAATSAPADAFHLGKRGRIANGYKADLLLVQGDPGADIAATRRIVEVWKDGQPVSPLRDKQRQRVAQERLPSQDERIAIPADGRISLFSHEKLASPFGLGWTPAGDSMMGGKSTVALKVLDGEPGGPMALAVTADIQPGFQYPWAGVSFWPGKQMMLPADLSAAKAIRFRVRGDGKAYAVTMMSKGVMVPVSVPFTATATWQEVSIPFTRFAGIDVDLITMIGFNAGPNTGVHEFQLADVRLVND